MRKNWLAALACTLSMIFAIMSCTPEDDVNPQVVMLGDSIFALSDEIAHELERLSGERYRTYYITGAQMEGSFVKAMKPIPDQYNNAVQADGDIRTIIMDGGGNDIQIGARFACTNGAVTTACKKALAPALTAAENLLKQMRADGVQNIVYMNYFYIMDADSKPAFNWMHAEMAKLVQKYNGLIVDPMPYMTDDLIGPDHIHPTDEGSRMLANLIWDALKANCIEQPAGCTPGSGSSSSGESN